MYLLRRIERYLRSGGMPPTRFGCEVLRDPQFVFDLRRGREPRPPTVVRVLAYLAAKEGEQAPCSR